MPTKKRTTVMIDSETLKKLRNLQAKRIRNTGKNVSLSQIINEVLRKELI